MNKAVLAVSAVIGISIGLYFGLRTGESPALPDADFSQVEALRDGDMMKLQFGVNRGSDVAFAHEDGQDITLADYNGKYVVLNFWATWCAPCRKEMPHLSDLQAEFQGERFEVVTVATGTNQRPAMERFLDEIGVDNLPLHTDASSAFARDFGVIGLPATLIINPEGLEIARMQGDADWASDSAKAIVEALLDER